MSALVATHMSRPTSGMLAGLRSFRAHEPRLFDLGALLLIAMLPTAFAALVDQRLFQGINVWDKPLKFEFALGVYVLTLVFFARFLPAGTTGKRWYRAYAAVVVVAIVAEMLWIGGAAAMAIPSHFSQTPLGGAIYGLMGIAAVILTSLSTVYALQIRRNAATGLSPAVKESLVLGLVLVLPLTLITAGTMSSMGGHWVGGAPTDAGSLALIGWARDGGDLRVAHFFATHAMHFIPAFGLVSAQLVGPDNTTPVRIFSAVFAAFVAYTFVEALMGRPFLPFLG
jgi:hypothetical protein